MTEKLGDGMYDKVKEHDVAIVDHGERLSLLEESGKRHEDRLIQLENQSERLETTVMREARDTQATMKEQGDRMFGLVESTINYKTDTERQEHEFRMLKLNTWSTVFLKISGGIVALLSAGGGAYYALQYLFGGGQ